MTLLKTHYSANWERRKIIALQLRQNHRRISKSSHNFKIDDQRKVLSSIKSHLANELTTACTLLYGLAQSKRNRSNACQCVLFYRSIGLNKRKRTRVERENLIPASLSICGFYSLFALVSLCQLKLFRTLAGPLASVNTASCRIVFTLLVQCFSYNCFWLSAFFVLLENRLQRFRLRRVHTHTHSSTDFQCRRCDSMCHRRQRHTYIYTPSEKCAHGNMIFNR